MPRIHTVTVGLRPRAGPAARLSEDVLFKLNH